MLDALNNWRLTRKMLVAFSAIALIVGGLGTAAVISNKVTGEAEQEYAAHSLPTMISIARFLGAVRESRILVYGHMSARDAREIAVLEQRITLGRQNMMKALDALSGVADPAFAPDIARMKEDLGKLEAVNGRILDLSRQRRQQETLALLKTEGKDASTVVVRDGDGLMERAAEQFREKSIASDRFTSRMYTGIIVLVLLAAGILVSVWALLNRTFTRPLGELTSATTVLAEGGAATVPYRDRADELGEIAKAVEQFRLGVVARQEADRKHVEEQAFVTSTLSDSLSALAKGDLTAEVTASFPEGVASLKTNFNDAVVNLRGMIQSVSDATDGIRTASTEIAQAAEDLARRTEGNAASLEETSAALTQIDGRLKGTAEAAARTVERADQAIATVSGGRSIADEAVQAMERVRASATGIDSVIEGLDKIAFQTRVLAMNAAVEAGRAGDAGRGFAVVADLVSSLAMRAEEEAKRARDQLTVTQSDIVTAVGAVERVDGALADISGDVSEVHTLLGGMASDNQAQSAAITQISAAVGSMDQSTQQNAAMVEETSAAARNLTREVGSLAEQAALFKVEAQQAQPQGMVRKAEAPKAAAPAKRPYVSPVKPLPVPKVAQAAGGAQLQVSDVGNDDWSDF